MMPELATILSELDSPSPKYRLFQTVVIYFLDEDRIGHFDKAVVVGYHLALPGDVSGWWYWLWFSGPGLSPWLSRPFMEDCHQSEIWDVID